MVSCFSIFKNVIKLKLASFFFKVLRYIKFERNYKKNGLSLTEIVFLEMKIDYVTFIYNET